MPYSVAIVGLESVFTFTTLITSLYSLAISLIIGAIILHGPHQRALKSTKTIDVHLITSKSKEESKTCKIDKINFSDIYTLLTVSVTYKDLV